MRPISALFVVLALAVSVQAQHPPTYKNYQPPRSQQYAYPPNYYQPYYVVPKQPVASLTFEVYKIGDGQWGWELKLDTKSLSKSVEVYKTKQDAAQVAQELFGAARTVVVTERAATIGKAAASAAQEAVESARIKNDLKDLGVEFPNVPKK